MPSHTLFAVESDTCRLELLAGDSLGRRITHMPRSHKPPSSPYLLKPLPGTFPCRRRLGALRFQLAGS